MQRPDPGVYLEDIEYYAAAAIRYLGGCTLAQYLADEKTRSAVERALEIVGEATRKLREHAPDITERIPHAHEIIGFRNVLAHGYAQVDDERSIESSRTASRRCFRPSVMCSRIIRSRTPDRPGTVRFRQMFGNQWSTNTALVES